MLFNIDEGDLEKLCENAKRYRDALEEIAAGDASREQMISWARLAIGDGIQCADCGLEHDCDCDVTCIRCGHEQLGTDENGLCDDCGYRPEPFSESPTWREDNERYERMSFERD
jgi:hypothetical protein